jgi:uncharacterized protein YjiS (DUF1127 family)
MKLTSTASLAAETSVGENRVVNVMKSIVARARKANANRALHRQFADMDDAVLRDIGLGDDEIYRVRAGRPVVPRAWN